MKYRKRGHSDLYALIWTEPEGHLFFFVALFEKKGTYDHFEMVLEAEDMFDLRCCLEKKKEPLT
jgi:hypothetical protein